MKHERQLYIPLSGLKCQHSLPLFLGMHLNCSTLLVCGAAVQLLRPSADLRVCADEIQKKYTSKGWKFWSETTVLA